MTTQHVSVGLVAGDDWEINITLLNADGTPFDLTGATVKWCLMDNSYNQAITTDQVTISVANPTTGVAQVIIPAAVSSPLPSGFYTDTLRVISAGITSTLLFGQINVMADPWAAKVGPARGTIVPFQRTAWIQAHPDDLPKRRQPA
jgi:hypothetical protein